MSIAGLALILAVLVTSQGCVTTLGYVPENIKPSNKTTYLPEYSEVKKWAYDVQDGLDSRATANRYASHYGALVGAAAVATLAGLAVFDSGSSAIAGIPIGTGFLAATASIYNNDQKADMYDRASKYVKTLINLSDQRVADRRKTDPNFNGDLAEALCLKRDVDELLRRVGRYVTFMDPKNVSGLLAKVKPGVKLEDLETDLKAARGDFTDIDSGLDDKGAEKVKSVCKSS